MTKINSILLSLLILIFSASGCTEANDVAGTSTPVVPTIEEEQPDNDWQFDTPENHGVDGAILESLHEAIKKIEIYSVVIVKDGYIIDEYYRQGYDERSVFRVAAQDFWQKFSRFLAKTKNYFLDVLYLPVHP